MISSSEIKVFKTVGFKMPLYTPLHYIEILLAATGLGETPNIVNVSIDLLDLAYLKVWIFDIFVFISSCNLQFIIRISLKVVFISSTTDYIRNFIYITYARMF